MKHVIAAIAILVLCGCSLPDVDLPDIPGTVATTTTTTTTTQPDTALHWLGRLTADRGIAGTLHSVSLGASRITLDYDVPFTHGALCVFVWRDGRWTGGRIEDLRPTDGHPTQRVKLRHNLDSGYLGKWGYGRDKIKPRSGEALRWCIASNKSRQRTPFVETVYP